MYNRALQQQDLLQRNGGITMDGWDNDDKSLFSMEELNKNQKIYADFWGNVRQIVAIKNQRSTTKRKLGKFHHLKYSASSSTDQTVKGDYIFDPLGTWRVRWSFVIIVLVIYSVLIVPFRIGWSSQESISDSVVDYCIDALFLVDIFVNFNTAYVDDVSEIMVYEYDRIARRYIRSWLIVDFLCCFPVEVVITDITVNSANYFHSFKVLRFLRFFRLTKLLRTNTVGNDEFFQLHRPLFNLLTLAIQIMFICHVFACIWHYIAADEPTSWITDCLGPSETSDFDTYVASLYFILVTMFTIGYGDIHATTTQERCFAMVVMLTGGIIFGAVLSNVTTLLEKQNPRATAHKEKMAELKDFLENSNVPLTFQHDAKEAFDYYLSKKTSFGESDILKDLPRQTVLKLIHNVYAKDIKKVKVFRTYDKSFVADLITNTRPFHVIRGEKIFEEGDVLNDIIFIESGLIALSKFNGTENVIVGLSRDGGYFGDFEYLKNTTCIASYSARKNSSLLSISHTVIGEAMANSVCGGQFRTELKERYKLFLKISGEYSTTDAQLKKPLAVPKMSRFSNRVRSVLKSEVPIKEEKIWLDGVSRTKQFLTQISLDLKIDSSSSTAVKTYKVITLGSNGLHVVKEVEARALLRAFIFHPNDPIRLCWDIIIAILIVTSVIEVSVDLAFNGNMFSSNLEIALAALYAVDICVSFRTAFHENEEDAYCIIPQRIYKGYLSSWFIIDFLSMIPVDLLVMAMSSGASGTSTSYNNAIKVLRIFRLTKIIRILKIRSLISRLELVIGLPSTVFDFISLMFRVLIIGHFIACIWWGFSSLTSDPGTAWFENPTIVGGIDVRNGPIGLRYLWSLYWAITTMTTVGYGDVHASNTNERIVNIFILFIGASVFGFIVANVSAIMEAMSKRSTLISDRMRQVAEYLKEKECPADLSHEILRHFKHLYGLKNSAQGREVLNNLPVKVKNKILLFQHNRELQKISIFKYIPNNSVRLYLFDLMKPVFFHTGQAMITEGDQATDIIFLISGSAIASKVHSYGSDNDLAKKKSDDSEIVADESKLKKSKKSAMTIDSLKSSFKNHFKFPVPKQSPNDEDHFAGNVDDSHVDAKTAEDPTLASGVHTAQVKTQHTGSKVGSVQRMTASWFLDTDSPSKDDPADMHDFMKWKNNPEELRRRSIMIIGDILPGTFFGHAALLDQDVHKLSIVASSVSCVYTISSLEIVRLVQDEPSVAVQFQHALSAAIHDQSQLMERANTTRSKKVFITSLKEKFYKSRVAGAELSPTKPIKAMSCAPFPIKLKPFKIYPSKVLGRYDPYRGSEKTVKFNHQSLSHLENILSDKNIMKDLDSDEDVNKSMVSKTKEKRSATTLLVNQKTSSTSRSIFTVASGISSMLSLYSKHKRKRVRCYSTSDLMSFGKEQHGITRVYGRKDESQGGAYKHTRRQSFPSLDNLQWKIAVSHDGLN